VLVLADLGIAVVGTLVSALAVGARARELLVPLLALPLLIPVLIGAARATSPLLAQGGADALPVRWLAILALYDVVFGLLSYAVFDYLLED
jgi:heme exporter protein B